jgi:hypothetical protein
MLAESGVESAVAMLAKQKNEPANLLRGHTRAPLRRLQEIRTCDEGDVFL